MDRLWQDIRYAAHQLRTNPGFTIAAVLTLALGIGANTAMFSVVNAVLLRPLPYHQPERLVGLSLDGLDYVGTFLQFRERAKTLDVAAYNPAGTEVTLTGSGEPVQLKGAAVSSNFFAVLGAQASIGRMFLPSEGEAGHAAVVLLSEGLWRSRFGGDRTIVGQQISLDGVSRTIVGVMPPDVRFPTVATQLWIPLAPDPANRVALWSTSATLVGRLHPGVTISRASTEVATLTPQMLALFPWSMPERFGRATDVEPLQQRIVGDVAPMLFILLGAVAFVLLIACVNVANLLLVRTGARQREIAIRTVLGAQRGRLVRQMLTESMLLALLGGAVGLMLAFLGVRLLRMLLPADTPRLAEIAIDGRVLVVTLVVALVTGVIFGLLPALRAGRTDPQSALREGGRGTSAGPGRRRLSRVLVASEVALAVVLVTGAGLLLRSFQHLLRINPGFRTESVVSASVALPRFRLADDVSKRTFTEELLQRVDALPGVRAAALTTRLPFGGRNYSSVFIIEGRPDPATTGDWPLADVATTVSVDYLSTMGIPLLRGRAFSASDREGAPPVVLISENLARKYWPDEDAVGKRIKGPGNGGWWTVVGIVGDVKHDQLSESSRTAFYRPIGQAPMDNAVSVVIRTTADPRSVATSLRGVVSSIDADIPVSEIRTMSDLIAGSLARPRFAMVLLGAFGLLALGLGAIGVYGVLAQTVGDRMREIGLRVALGARPADVLRMVIGQGFGLALTGVAVGLAISAAITRLLAGLLYGVGTTDPVTFAMVPLVLVVVALLASYLPARRAAAVDPMVALRSE
jgi:putative ABC transport system permease protein